jgi:aminoglycoside 3-N-acetyltransferase
MVTNQAIRNAVRELKICNSIVCQHASLRSFGWVEGGAATVVSGLLAEGCTVMVPTFSFSFAVPPPPDQQPAQNGWDYDRFEGSRAGIGRVFNSKSLEFDRADMGAIPAAVLATPQHRRGNHPLCSLSAVGPLARKLVAKQQPLDVWAPFEGLVEANGSVILMGVGLDKLTLLHFAEKQAGRIPFRRWANGPNGQPMMVEVGGCSDGFEKFMPILAPIMKELKVGGSIWRIFPAKDTLAVATSTIRQNPKITHCGNSHCNRCNDAVRGGPII